VLKSCWRGHMCSILRLNRDNFFIQTLYYCLQASFLQPEHCMEKLVHVKQCLAPMQNCVQSIGVALCKLESFTLCIFWSAIHGVSLPYAHLLTGLARWRMDIIATACGSKT
jgi:hypothetical protein